MLSKDILQEIDWTKFGKYMMDVPFEVIRRSLYTSDELFKEFDSSNPSTFQDCFDTRVYNYMMEKGKLTNDHLECSARSMHDCTMRQCLRDFLGKFEQNHVVGIMGGHAMLRTDEAYAKTVFVSKKLTELGYLMISGGGPGAMEATHLGAWLAGRTEDEVKEALEIVGKAPSFKDELWMSTSFECKSCFPRLGEYESLAIPTWFYGHEPPTAFATHIAKFFDNSIREDTILTEAYGGLIYMPGSAGTLQEIFQEAVQDHYVCFGYPSPMVFVGEDYWNKEVPVIPFVDYMIKSGHYKNLLINVVDSADDIVKSIVDFKKIYDSKYKK